MPDKLILCQLPIGIDKDNARRYMLSVYHAHIHDIRRKLDNFCIVFQFGVCMVNACVYQMMHIGRISWIENIKHQTIHFDWNFVCSGLTDLTFPVYGSADTNVQNEISTHCQWKLETKYHIKHVWNMCVCFFFHASSFTTHNIESPLFRLNSSAICASRARRYMVNRHESISLCHIFNNNNNKNG